MAMEAGLTDMHTLLPAPGSGMSGVDEQRWGEVPTISNPGLGQAAHHYSIVTPEGVALRFPAAGFASRSLAAIVDLTIKTVIMAVSLVFAALLTFASEVFFYVFVAVLSFVVTFLYSALFEWRNQGATPGKALLGIRVIRDDGRPLSFITAALRSIVGIVDFWTPIPGGAVALFSSLISPQGKRLGDYAAGTVVVVDGAEKAKPMFLNVATATGPLRHVDTAGISPELHALCREFIARYLEFTPEAATHLAEVLAARLETATTMPCPPSMPKRDYVAAIVAARQVAAAKPLKPGSQSSL